jgi:hypothetical protein
MPRRVILGVLLVVGIVPAGCGGTSTREQVDSYVKAANAVQASAAPSFAEANRSYARFQRRRLNDPGDVQRLVAAQTAIQRTKARLARIPAPRAARELRAKLLLVYSLNESLARETVMLARYAPARQRVLEAVALANRRLVSSLKHARQASAQAAALTTYRGSVNRAITALSHLDPPPVTRSIHRAQLKRLAASRRLASALRAAVLARDSRRTAQLVIAFRQIGNVSAGERALETRDLAAYVQRRRTIADAMSQVTRERARLDRAK